MRFNKEYRIILINFKISFNTSFNQSLKWAEIKAQITMKYLKLTLNHEDKNVSSTHWKLQIWKENSNVGLIEYFVINFDSNSSEYILVKY